MQLTRFQRLSISLIALLAIGWAQAFGLHRGWLCDHCDGEHITQVDHCHGPHATAQHEDEDHKIPHHHEETDEDTHSLPEVKSSLLAKQQNSIIAGLAAPSLPVIAEIVWDSVPHVLSIASAPVQAGRKPPDWLHRITQTISLRI